MNHRSVVILVASSALIACGGAPFEFAPQREAIVIPEAGIDGAADPAHEAGTPEHAAPEAGEDADADARDAGTETRDAASDADVPDARMTDAAADAAADVAPDAPPDSALDAPACVTDLSGVGQGDFTIAFTLTTTETGLTLALLNQRTGCDTQSPFWDVWLGPTGGVTVATDQNAPSNYVFVEGGNSLNDGQPHAVQIIRRGGQLWYASDGVAHSATVPDPDNFGALATLVIGSSACSGHDPAAGHAAIADVCLTMP